MSKAKEAVWQVWRVFLSIASLGALATLVLAPTPPEVWAAMTHDVFSVLWSVFNVAVYVGLYAGVLWLLWFNHE